MIGEAASDGRERQRGGGAKALQGPVVLLPDECVLLLFDRNQVLT